MLKIEQKDRVGMIALMRNLSREDSLGSKQVKGLFFRSSRDLLHHNRTKEDIMGGTQISAASEAGS